MQKKFSLKNNRLAKTIIVSGLILIAALFVILRYEGFFAVISKGLSIFRPVIIGGVIAFALNRPLNFVYAKYRKLFGAVKRAFKKRFDKKGRISDSVGHKVPFACACFTTYILTFAIITGIICFIVPQISDSVTLFKDNFNVYFENLKVFMERFKFIGDSEIFAKIDLDEIAGKITEKLSSLTEYIPTVLEKTYGITTSIIGVIVDLVVGIVFSIYILIDKKNLKKYATVLSKAVIKKNYDKFEKMVVLSYDTFSKFISGQVAEAFILGILCFIGMSIFGFDYAPLISVIIGITNMIPIAGPILGTIPCALILLLVKPIDAVWFVVFIIVIQQIDSNLIYPKVVGNSIGLPALWVLFAITVGGGLGGVLGMIIGVPLMSILYTLLGEKLSTEQQVQNIKEQKME